VLRIGKFLFGDLLSQMKNIGVDVGRAKNIFIVAVGDIAAFELNTRDVSPSVRRTPTPGRIVDVLV
jgi:hypothetical protein